MIIIQSTIPMKNLLLWKAYRARLLLALFSCGLAMAPLANGQVLNYTFNDAAGTTVANSGSLGASGNLTMRDPTGVTADYLSNYSSGGISSQNGTQTLNLTSATGMGNAGGSWTGPYASNSSAGSVLSGATSFTLTGWYNAAITIGGASRLYQIGGTTQVILSFASSSQMSLQVGADSHNSNATSGVTVLPGTGTVNVNTTNSWTFFAATYAYDPGSGLVTEAFYTGTTAGSLASYAFTYTPTTTTVGTETSIALGSGSASGTNSRPWKGSFDDFSVYASTSGSTGALDYSAINSIYLATVPEPSTVLMVSMGIMCFGLVRFGRGRKAIRIG